jgi:tRNA (guanine-N7-)-methyltransferase
MSTPEFLAIREQRTGAIRQDLATCLGSGLRNFVFEIGCGHGHFLTSYAASFPGRTCIGVDRDSERVARAMRKRDRAQLPNLHFLRADAVLFMEVLPPEVRVADVFVLFPDPWPKARHHKHRLIQAAFLDLLATKAEPTARLMFRTDHRDYFDEARATVAAHPRWQLVEEPWPFEFETIFQQRAASHQSFIARPRIGSTRD